MTPRHLAVLFVCLTGCHRAHPHAHVDVAKAKADVATVLDAWHDAAARADENAYFGHFATNGVFIGTDATERWDVAAFRSYAHPHFAKGKAWAFKSTRRDVTISNDGATAWFDESLSTPHLGPARGSGVLVREGGAWKIALYDLSIPIPNERFKDVKKVIEGSAAVPSTSASP